MTSDQTEETLVPWEDIEQEIARNGGYMGSDQGIHTGIIGHVKALEEKYEKLRKDLDDALEEVPEEEVVKQEVSEQKKGRG
jgi:hypothetical protein